MSDRVSHPVFARVFDRLAAKAEAAGQGAHRAELLLGLSGRVIEVGAADCLNFKHYPPPSPAVLAVEPEDYLRQRAKDPRPARCQDAIGPGWRLLGGGCHPNRDTG